MKQTFFAVAALMLFGFASPAYSDNINSFILYPEGPYALLPLDYATGINNVGQIVAGNCFYNRAQGSCTNLPIGPQAINDKGQMAGTDNSTAFTYIGGSVTYLAVPGATYSFANGINNATQVVGTYLWPVPNSDRFYNANGFLYSGGAYTIISFPGDTASCTILALASIRLSPLPAFSRRASMTQTRSWATTASTVISHRPRRIGSARLAQEEGRRLIGLFT